MKKFDPETFGPLLGGTARAWRLKLDARLKPMGLSQAKWRTLLHLSRTPEPLTQSQIAERTGSCKTVHLQPRTARVINRINATALKLRHELIKDIPVREMQTCMRVLNEVRARAERARGNGETGADTGK
ncbi:MAG: hypothetical protein DME42_12285 [Verrucomicrobia bacterium]|nr:MAG: hypothetical protein DME42_12285 [Verrucomicrobiota bacterium]